MAVNEFKYLNKTYDRIRSAKATLYESLSLSTLQVDTLTVVVVSEEAPEVIVPPPLSPEFSRPEGIISGGFPLFYDHCPLVSEVESEEPIPPPPYIPPYNFDSYIYGTECFYYHDGGLFGKYYVTEIEQVDRLDWKFTCVSALGLLLNSYHYGGIYQGASAKEVITDIVGGVVPFSFDANMDRVKLYGWLPKNTRRDNLKLALFAANAQILKNSNGDMVFRAFDLTTATTPKVITKAKYYLTGNKVTKGSPATQAQVTEHSYFSSPDNVVVKAFSGEAKGDTFTSPQGVRRTGCLVDFKQPLHDLSISGSTILESGVNYAIIKESANAVLTGKAYTHTERTLFMTKTDSAPKPNVVRCTNCHLVSVVNSELVAKRLIAYYGEARKVTCDLWVSQGERPGDPVSFVDPWSGETMSGFIQSMEINFSKELRARTVLISGYYPPVQEEEQNFTHRVVLTGSGTWTVPTSIPGSTAKVKKVRYNLFSGATGGAGGQGGQSGTASSMSKSWSRISPITGQVTSKGKTFYPDGPGGSGGSGGSGGRGSRVLSGTLDVTPGQVISFSCGIGGSGGAGGSGGSKSANANGSTGSRGSEGAATTFGNLSSALGTFPASTGWVDVITGEVYCLPGPVGGKGGNGAGRDTSVELPPRLPYFNLIPFIPATAAVDQNGRSWPGAPTRSGATVGSSETDVGANGIQRVQFTSTESTGTGASYGLGPGGVAGVTQGTMNARGSQSTVAATAISGQTPPPPVAAPPMSTPTRGGYGGYGGGGASSAGGSSKEVSPSGDASYRLSGGSVGAGGAGGKGGTAGPGLIILYY